MSIKRFYATKDNTITNAYKPNLTTRATGSNMALQIFWRFLAYMGKLTLLQMN